MSDHRGRHPLVVALAVTSGATDAIGFLALGGAFTSVMTGNLVLLGISAAETDGSLASHTGAAIVCFIAGCAIGARIAGTARPDDPLWPPAITRALLVEAAVFLAYAAVWWSVGSHPHDGVQLGLLAMNAVATGIQSSTVQRFGVSGLSTTYLTGTLTTVVIRLATGRPLRDVARSVHILIGLITGAALGALAVRHAPVAAPFVQLTSLGLVLSARLLVTVRGHDPLRAPSS